MEDITFDKLPEAVARLFEKLNKIESLLQEQGPTSQPEFDQLLTIKEAAEFLNLSVPTIYDYVRKGKIPSSKKARRLYFSKKDLIEWIKGGSKTTTAEITYRAERHIQDTRRKRRQNA